MELGIRIQGVSQGLVELSLPRRSGDELSRAGGFERDSVQMTKNFPLCLNVRCLLQSAVDFPG